MTGLYSVRIVMVCTIWECVKANLNIKQTLGGVFTLGSGGWAEGLSKL